MVQRRQFLKLGASVAAVLAPLPLEGVMNFDITAPRSRFKPGSKPFTTVCIARGHGSHDNHASSPRFVGLADGRKGAKGAASLRSDMLRIACW